MAKLEWDKTGERFYETGTTHGVLYLLNKTTNAYDKGVVWNGLTAVTESPAGADVNDMYADDIKYASLRAAETFGATVEAYTYPEEFALCDGSAEVAPGIMIGQQNRETFGFSYRTKISNDMNVDGYKLHLVYGATASPSEKSYATINDSPDAITFSWEFNTTPINVSGFKPTSILTINSLKIDADKLKTIEDLLYGTDSDEAKLPTPEEIIAIMGDTDSENTETVAFG